MSPMNEDDQITRDGMKPNTRRPYEDSFWGTNSPELKTAAVVSPFLMRLGQNLMCVQNYQKDMWNDRINLHRAECKFFFELTNVQNRKCSNDVERSVEAHHMFNALFYNQFHCAISRALLMREPNFKKARLP